jgi:hypothetical protein
MSKQIAFKEELLRLVEKIPDGPSLLQAQYAYRQIIFFMGLKILETFPEAAIGLPPSGRGEQEAFDRESLMEAVNAVVEAEIRVGGGYIGRGPEMAAGGGGQTGGGHINAIIKIAGIALGLKSPTPPPK